MTLIGRCDVPIPAVMRDISIFVESYNCGEKWLTEIDVRNVIPEGKDVYIISLQECMNSSKSVSSLLSLLSPNGEYVVETYSIGSYWRWLGFHGNVTIIALVRKSILNNFCLRPGSKARMGLNLGVCRLGNKGSVAITMRIGGQVIMAIAAHFSSDLKVRLEVGDDE